jgi:hypothetical protein
MAHNRNRRFLSDDLDGLRLIAVGRIPRCGSCPRYRALVEAAGGGGARGAVLPAVPQKCSHQVCAPLVDRILQPRRTGDRLFASAS